MEKFKLLTELEKPNFIAVASRPGVGKTTFMLDKAIENAKLGTKTLFISFEMGSSVIYKKIINNLTKENLDLINSEKDKKFYEEFKSNEFLKLVNNNLDTKFYDINDPIKDFIPTIENLIKENNYEIIFIDDIQFFNNQDHDRFSSFELFKLLKDLSIETNTFLVCSILEKLPNNKLILPHSSKYSIESYFNTIINLKRTDETRKDEKFVIKIKEINNATKNINCIKAIVNYPISRFYLL